MNEQAIFNAIASGVCAIGYALHAFGGGALMARPFYAKAPAAGIPAGAFRYCWHFVSVTLVAMSAGYLALVWHPGQSAPGILWTAMALSLCALAVIVSMIGKSSPLKSPPALIFAIVAAAGIAALAAR